MLIQKRNFVVDRNITQLNVNISIALSVNLQQTNVQRSFFLLVAYRTFSKQHKRAVKKGLFKKKEKKKKKLFQMVGYHKITWYLQDFQNQFEDL